ncbi:MAG: heme lyase CcmF/NrfE family subunit, partial [Proteobacteria bacterium]|nr:heme lyase CcmF/NrfE family subunit [Pseudomonadota bacterium]
AAGVAVFAAVSFAGLLYAFVTDDFSVRYAATNSNSLLPIYYKVAAVWGAHEGSFLLWILIMTLWTLAVATFSRHLPLTMISRVLAVMGWLTAGFAAFSLFTSNPFERALPIPPAEGSDLNPLLQDFGLTIHPPMLYIGYVGFSVAFAFALAALMTGRLDAAWARWSRPWTNAAWAFLTTGIALGSWWAYYELGWGGWWFWDPVENASFMPWLMGTALVHSLAVTEKRGAFKSWTVLLAIGAFSLSLLGAFIVRSGVLTSVHAFAVDPERGLFILAFLVIVVGGSLTLYAVRVPLIRSRVHFSGLSREVLLLVNNVVLVVAMSVVLLGTLYPLAYEAITDGGKISVGPPYFNSVFIPLMAVLSLALGIGPSARWKRTSVVYLVRKLGAVFAASLVIGVALPLVVTGVFKWQVAAGSVAALWIVGTHIEDLWQQSGGRFAGLRRLSAGYLGMTLAHLGFAVTLIGIVITSHLSVERDVRLTNGASTTLGELTFTLVAVDRVSGPNYLADRGTVRVDGEGDGYVLFPEKRRYLAGGNVMTEAAIDAGVTRDVYVAMGEPLDEGGWTLRLHYKPLVRWVWVGALLMALGGVTAVTDARYRRLRVRRDSAVRTAAAEAQA